jgi:hypothetical protein
VREQRIRSSKPQAQRTWLVLAATSPASRHERSPNSFASMRQPFEADRRALAINDFPQQRCACARVP